MIERRYLQMKIKQAAEKSGLTPRNIRFYEESGLNRCRKRRKWISRI